MSNYNIDRAISISRVIFAALLLAFGTISCGGKSLPRPIPPKQSSYPSTSPTIILTATSSSIPYNTSTTINWSSTDSTSCFASSGSSDTGQAGVITTGNLTSTTTYIVTCTGTGGSASKSITITVAPSHITGFADAGSGNVTVTSQNALVNGATITISGTVSYNQTYIVTNVTPSSFTIVAAYVADSSTTGVWRLEGGMVDGCPLIGSTGTIQLQYTPSRFTGVAPLAVFFDATSTSTTATVTTFPFHELEYQWDFGDAAGSPVSGTTWKTGSQPNINSRNSATGPVAAHVYETPGTYLVTVSAKHSNSSVKAFQCARIVVQDPDVVFANTQTYCFSTSGNFTDCPTTQNHITLTNFHTAITTYQGTGRRLLFRRGEIFTTTTGTSLTANGPGIVGSFGTGALPVIQFTPNDTQTTLLTISSPSTPNFSDWRLMDLNFDGQGSYQSVGVDAGGGFSQFTMLRVSFNNLTSSINCDGTMAAYINDHNGPYGQGVDQTAIVDNTVTPGTNTQYGAYLSGNRLAFMGNSLDAGGNQTLTNHLGNVVAGVHGSHVSRWTYLGKAIISNNDFSHPGFDRGNIKLHAPTWTNGVQPPNQPWEGDGWTKQVVISDNKLTDYLNPWSMDASPQNGGTDERVRDVILERNRVFTTATSAAAFVIHASQVTVRNNLSDGGNSVVQVGIMGIEPPAQNVWIYNNTHYNLAALPNSQFASIDIRDAVSNITLKNNLAYAPNSNTPHMYVNSIATNVIASYNSSDAQVKGTPPFAAPPASLAGWIPTAKDYINMGDATVPVWSDFFLNSRMINVIDIGAVEAP